MLQSHFLVQINHWFYKQWNFLSCVALDTHEGKADGGLFLLHFNSFYADQDQISSSNLD